jgi:hypothetical protein
MAVAALVREPQDRAEAVRPAIEALGGKLLSGQEWIESLRMVQGSQYRPPR